MDKGAMPKGVELPFDRSSVMVIDDDRYTRSLVKGVLYHIGFAAVVEAQNGVEALSLLQQHSVDLIISDIRMEPMDGLGLLERLRTARPKDGTVPPTAAVVPVLFLTARSDVEVVERAKAAGASGFLLKPIRPDILRERITAILTAAWTA